MHWLLHMLASFELSDIDACQSQGVTFNLDIVMPCFQSSETWSYLFNYHHDVSYQEFALLLLVNQPHYDILTKYDSSSSSTSYEPIAMPPSTLKVCPVM